MSILTSMRAKAWSIPLALLTFAVVFFVKSWLAFSGATLGHDYSFVYPRLGAYLFWAERNGYWSIPYFLPYQCAGIFDFADLQSAYFSFPTAMAMLFPVHWVWPMTMIFFGLAGATGGYAFARFGLGTRHSSAILCGLIMLCNEFFMVRVAVGHVLFHGIMLLPWIALQCLRSRGDYGLKQDLPAVAGIALLFSYLVYSGGIQLILPSILSLGILLLAVPIPYRDRLRGWLRLGVGGLLALAISGVKLAESFHLMSHLSRGFYPLPGFKDLFTTLGFAVSALFFEPTAPFMHENIVNTSFMIDIHEGIFGVTAIPLLALGFFVVMKSDSLGINAILKAVSVRYIVLAILLLLPIFLNTYNEGWTSFLKSIPVIGQSSNMVRWMMAYILPLAVLSACVFDKYSGGMPVERPLLFAAMLVLMLNLIQFDLHRFTSPGYSAELIERSLSGPGSGAPVPITEIGTKAGSIKGGDDTFLKGVSQVGCYNPIFGYRLEKLRYDNLKLGSAKQLVNGAFNFHNPACYVFPEENACQPGDNFRQDQAAELDKLLNYEPMNYRRPAYLQALGILSLAAAAVCLAATIYGLVRRPLATPAGLMSSR